MSLPRNNRENKPKKGGICVANHTSPIDIVILCNDGCYAMVQLLLLDVSTHLYHVQPNLNYHHCLNVFVRWVRFMEVWWESSREPWWGPVLTSGSREQRWKIATWWPKGELSTPAPLVRLVFALLFSPVFSLRGCSGIKRCWHFPGSEVF